MPKKIIIYGKDTWHYTTDARRDYDRKGYSVDYRNVAKDRNFLDEMLKISGGMRLVPVLVDEGKVKIGFGGTWGV